jgi:hypothetical protein
MNSESAGAPAPWARIKVVSDIIFSLFSALFSNILIATIDAPRAAARKKYLRPDNFPPSRVEQSVWGVYTVVVIQLILTDLKPLWSQPVRCKQ